MTWERRSMFAGVVLVIICLLPVLKPGLWSDDLGNFQSKTVNPARETTSTFTMAMGGVRYWQELGRFTPLSFVLDDAVYKRVNSVESYKAFLYLMNLLSVAAFLLLLHEIFPGFNKALWLFCFCAVIQFRITVHDAYTCFNGMYQMLSIFVFLSCFFHSRYFRTGRAAFLAPALLFLACAALTSEVGLVVLPLLFFIPTAGRSGIRDLVVKIFPGFIVAATYLVYVAYLRSQVVPGKEYLGLTTNTDPAAMLLLLAKHLYAALPMSNFSNRRGGFMQVWFQLRLPLNMLAVFTVVAMSYVVWRGSVRISANTDRVKLKQVLFSLALMAGPAMFILPSIKYQIDMPWGSGYLPVFLQNFGSALLFAFVLQWMIAKGFNSIGHRIMTVILTLCIVFGFLMNNSLINTRIYYHSFPSLAIFESAKDGMLNEAEDGSIIYLKQNYFWNDPQKYEEIFFRISGKKFKVRELSQWPLHDSTQACYQLSCPPTPVVEVKLERTNCQDTITGTTVYRRTFERVIKLSEDEIRLYK